jgi:phosphate uptake regulator
MGQPRLAHEQRILGTTAGGNTYMITLPKEWVEGMGLAKGDALTLVRVGSGIYFYQAQDREASVPTKKLELSTELSGKALERALISQYIAGYDAIYVLGDTITEEQREVIRQTAQRLIGEILQEGTLEDETTRKKRDFLLVQALRDPQVLHVRELLKYIYENAEEMLKDASQALLQGERKKADRVIQWDERVDRFFLRLSRQLYATLQDPLAEVERGISRVEFFNIHIVARQLERIADHAVKIAREAQALLEKVRGLPSDVAASIARTRDEVQALLHRAMWAFTHLDGGEAHRALGTLHAIEKLVKKLDERVMDLKDPHLAIVVDSFGRVKDYAANIAEVALNAEALRR